MIRILATTAMLFFAQLCPADRYVTGGPELPAPLQARLDENRETIRLGINTETLDKAGIAPVPFVQAILGLSDCVREGHLPGAVVYLNTVGGDNFPIGVGSRIVDPEPFPAEWSTIYEAGELTAMMAVVPFALQALERDKLRPGDTLGHFFPEFHGTDKESVTIEMLLRHSSGLAEPGPVARDAGRTDILRSIANAPLLFPPGSRSEKSVSNPLLLGLVVGQLCNAPIQEHALAELFYPAGLMNTVADLPPTWIVHTAPGPYSTWYDRLVWAEPEDPSAHVLGKSAGHGGLFTSCDDLGLLSNVYLSLARGEVPDICTTPTLQLATTPAPAIPGGMRMGLGLELDGFGEGSFGWNASNGSSLWINPRADAYLAILTNRNHPMERSATDHPCAARATELLRKSVRALGPDV